MKKLAKYAVNRFKEPSSWAGLSALAMMAGMPPDAANAIVQALGSIAAAAAVLMPSE